MLKELRAEKVKGVVSHKLLAYLTCIHVTYSQSKRYRRLLVVNQILRVISVVGERHNLLRHTRPRSKGKTMVVRLRFQTTSIGKRVRIRLTLATRICSTLRVAK